MCLILKPNSKIARAKKDIVCYKILKKADNIEIFRLGDSTGPIVASIVDDRLMLGTLYQELISHKDNDLVEKVKNSPNLVSFKPQTNYVTYVRNFPVEIGKVYYSKLRKEVAECDTGYLYGPKLIQVIKGLHSYADLKYCLEEIRPIKALHVVECVIPKGFYYYKGEYNHTESYASSALKYVKIINE